MSSSINLFSFQRFDFLEVIFNNVKNNIGLITCYKVQYKIKLMPEVDG